MKALFCFFVTLIFISGICGQTINPAGPIDLCPGGSVVLTATGGTSYQWQRNAANIAGATLSTYFVTAAGSYTVILNGGMNPGDTLGPVIVNAVTNPIASFTFTPNNTCANTPVSFTNTSTGTGISYLWTFGDPNSGANNTSTATSPVHNFIGNPGTGTQMFTVKLVVTSSAGCKDSITATVTNLQRPGTELGGTGSTIYNGLLYFKVCSLSSSSLFTFINQSTTGATNIDYKIVWGDGSPDFTQTTFTNTTHSYSVGNYALFFIVKGGNNCVDTGKYYVFVGKNPAVGLGNPGGTDVCMQAGLTFPITSTSPNPPGTIYTVTFNDGSAPVPFSHPPPASITHAFATSSCGTTSSDGSNTYPNSFSAVIVASNPCGTSSGGVVPIYVARKPVPSFAITPKDTACVNTTVTFTNNGINGTAGGGDCTTGKQVWSVSPATGWNIVTGPTGNDNGFDDPGLWTNGTNILRLNFTVPGVYTIKLKVGASAPGSFCGIDSITKTICVNPLPIASFTTNANTGCAPFVVNTTNTSSPVPFCGQNAYSWSVTYVSTAGCTPNTSGFTYINGTNASSINPQIQFNNPGVYTISLIAIAPAASCSSAVVTQQIIVKAKPIVNLGALAAICVNQSVSPAQTSTCYITAATTYDWQFPGGTPSSSTSANPGLITYAMSGNYTITLSVTNECGTTTVTTPLTVNQPSMPIIPVDTAFCAGTSVGSLILSSNPSGATIMWTNTNTAIGLGAGPFTGNLPAFTATNTGATPIFGIIRVQAGGGNCFGLDSFRITINPRPAIPLQTEIICSGSSFSVTPANGVPTAATVVPASTTYTWGSPVSAPLGAITGGSAQAVGQSSISQTLTNITNAAATLTYTVTPISGAAGNCTGTPFIVTITVNPIPVVQDTAAAICSGTSFSITPSVAVAGNIIPAGTTYTWPAPVSTPPGAITGGSGQGTGQSSITQTLTNITNAPATLTYTVTPGAAGNCNGTAFTITVTVNPKPAIPAQPQTICSGDVFSVTPVDGVPASTTIVPGGTTYTWQNPVSAPIGAITGGSAQASGQISISQTLTNTTNSPATLTYTVTPKSGAGGNCIGATFTVTVTVNPKPAIPALTAGICSGNTFTVTPVNGIPTVATVVPAGTLYTWTNPVSSPPAAITGGSAQAVGQTSISQTLINTLSSSATLTYTVTPTSGTSGNCVGNAFTVVVTVNPKPLVQNETALICSGDNFTITPSNATPGNAIPVGTVYTWANPISSPLAAITGGSAQALGQVSISQTLTNTTTLPATLTYIVTPSAGGTCAGTPFTVVVTVNPKPTIQNVTAIICSGDVFTVTPSNATPGNIIPLATTYTWTNPVSAPLGAITGGTAQAVGQSAISQTLTNTTNASATLTYTVTPTSGAAGSCVGMPFSVTVTVNPKPVVQNIASAICSGTAFSTTPTGAVSGNVIPAGTLYTWLNPVSAPLGVITGGSAQAVGQSSISQVLTNITNTSATLTYTVTPVAAGNCIGIPFRVTITVNPKPAIPAQAVTICSGELFTVSPANGVPASTTIVPAATTYTWPNPISTPIGAITGGSSQAVGQSNISQVLTNTTNLTGTLTYTVTPTSGVSGNCIGAAFTVVVTVNPKPTVQNEPAVICSGNTFTVTPSNATPGNAIPAGTVYTWPNPVSAPPAAITGGSAQAVGQSSISQTLTNTLNTSATLTYTVTPTSGGAGNCVGPTFTVIVTVNPKPVVQNESALICSGDVFTVTPSNVTPGNAIPVGTVYTWTNPVSSPLGAITGGTAQAVGQASISQTLINTLNVPATLTYTVTPLAGGNCSGTPFLVTVTVKPKPQLTSPLNPPSVCTNTPFNYTSVSSTSNTSFVWSRAAVPGISNPASTNNNSASINETLINTTTSPVTVIYSIDLLDNGCTNTQTVSLVVNPNAKSQFVTDTIIGCAPFNINQHLTVIRHQNANDEPQYRWFANAVQIGTGLAVPAYSILTPGTTVTIMLIAKSKFGCLDDTSSLTLTTVERPSLSFTKSIDSACGPVSILFTNTTTPISVFNGSAYLWNFGNGGVTSTAVQPGSITFQPSPLFRDTVYYITLRVITACDTLFKTDSVKVYANPKARFTSRSSGCSPFRDTLVNNSFGQDAFTKYYWDYGDGTRDTTYTTGIIYHTYNVGVITTFTLRLIMENRCGRDTQYVNTVVSPLNIVQNITVNGSDLYGCAPHTAYFQNSSVGAAFLDIDYGDGPPIVTIPNSQSVFNHTYFNPGIYNVQIKLRNDCSDTTVVRQITVYAPPKALFTLQKTLLCTGDTIFTNNISTNANAYEWLWGDGNSNSVFNTFHVYQNAGTYQVRLVAKKVNNFGLVCTDTSAITTVTVVDRIPSILVINPNSLPCVPYTVNVTASNAAGALQVDWYFYDATVTPGVFHFTGPQAAYTYNTPGVYTVKLVVQNIAGCKDSTTRQITVSKSPDVVFTPLDITTCTADTTINFNVTANANGGAPLTYEWYINSQLVGNGNPFSHRFTVPGNITATNIFNVQVYVRNVFGCGDTTVIGKLTINTLAPRYITVSPSLVQTQPDYTFTFSDTAAALPNSIYTWTTGDRSGQQLSGQSITYTYGDTGMYKVKMLIKDYATGCVLTDSVKVFVLHVPGYLWVANAFCPGCAKAELRQFLPLGKGLKDYQLIIYNIWGQKIFETTSLDANGSPNKGWDGNWPGGTLNVKQGAYSWQIKAHYINGAEWKGMTNPKTGQLQKQGYITILR